MRLFVFLPVLQKHNHKAQYRIYTYLPRLIPRSHQSATTLILPDWEETKNVVDDIRRRRLGQKFWMNREDSDENLETLQEYIDRCYKIIVMKKTQSVSSPAKGETLSFKSSCPTEPPRSTSPTCKDFADILDSIVQLRHEVVSDQDFTPCIQIPEGVFGIQPAADGNTRCWKRITTRLS